LGVGGAAERREQQNHQSSLHFLFDLKLKKIWGVRA